MQTTKMLANTTRVSVVRYQKLSWPSILRRA